MFTREPEFKKSLECPAILEVHPAPNGVNEELKYENIRAQTREMQLYCVTELQGVFVCASAYSVVFCS